MALHHLDHALLLTYTSLIAWMIGRADRALADARQAIELAAAAFGATMIELRATVRLARLLRGSDLAVVREVERLVAIAAAGGDAIDVRDARAVLT